MPVRRWMEMRNQRAVEEGALALHLLFHIVHFAF